ALCSSLCGDHRDLHSFPTRRSSDLSCPAARWVVPFTRPARNRSWAAFSVALMTAICSYISSSSSPVTVSPVIVFGSVIIGSVICTAPRRRVQVRLRLPQRVERAADGPVLATGDEQL